MNQKPYSKFSLIPETRIEGWIFGAITEFVPKDGGLITEGDGFVEAPDGTRAGLDWTTMGADIEAIAPPDDKTWGIYQVRFPQAVSSLDDLVHCFRHVLPLVKEKYKQNQK